MSTQYSLEIKLKNLPMFVLSLKLKTSQNWKCNSRSTSKWNIKQSYDSHAIIGVRACVRARWYNWATILGAGSRCCLALYIIDLERSTPLRSHLFLFTYQLTRFIDTAHVLPPSLARPPVTDTIMHGDLPFLAITSSLLLAHSRSPSLSQMASAFLVIGMPDAFMNGLVGGRY